MLLTDWLMGSKESKKKTKKKVNKKALKRKRLMAKASRRKNRCKK